MQTGTKISLAGHGVLVGWVAFGAWFPSEPLPIPVQEVSVISAEEFARLNHQAQAPDVSSESAALAAPAEETDAPELDLTQDPKAAAVPPVPIPQLEPETLPEEVPQEEIAEPDVPLLPPVELEQPEATGVVPQVSPEILQRPIDRVAPVPVVPPLPDTAVDDFEQPEVSPDVGAEEQQEVQQATAPEAATDRIVTEENQAEDAPITAPTQSLRPKGRPERVVPRPETPVEPETETPERTTSEPVEASAVEDAIAAAISGGADVEAPEPSGPPLTNGEKDALRVSVSKCWNVGALSSEALKTTVTVAVSMTPDGRPDTQSVRMISSTGGSSQAVKQAYEAARRAIIRCGAKGFQLPPQKYDHWRDIEMTFNPERMRIK